MPEAARPAGSPASSARAGAANPEFTTGYTNYVLGILFLVYVMNFVDRQILSILVEPIKASLGASDTQMGFLTGFAFAIFYTTFGIPLARWACLLYTSPSPRDRG